ncbi:MAG: 16S rRNA (cytosine(1402)-N(4))-methyltransferase RsmH, partial [Thermoplasmata archaeon]|nr:16S rRNA (cytosine(1402)-N(4))-methyltransferase RsmH [Thermoplasmata archaeon]
MTPGRDSNTDNTDNTGKGANKEERARTMCSPSTGTVEDSSSALFPAGRSGELPERASPVEGLQMVRQFVHEPVMASEVVDLFEPVPPGIVVDMTVGGGGHAAAILAAHAHLRIVGLDRDPDAVEAAGRALAPFGSRAVVRHARFDDLAAVIEEIDAGGQISGVLFDLGVSSPQLDRAERGFSYRQAGPLDMRMDPTTGSSALELVNALGERELVELFAEHGEARLARRIARAVIGARPISTTTGLADAVSSAVPAPARRRGHPARRVFQAVRVAVNDELGQLGRAIPAALDAVALGGRCVTIAYHSGEDRLVKRAFEVAVRG